MNENDNSARFTQRARKVLSLAQEEAKGFNHNYIGTEHLLLGLVRDSTSVAARVLASFGIDLDKVRKSVEFIIGRGDKMVTGDIGLTPRAKEVVELAADEARRMNHHFIGTEHLLLGQLREGQGIAIGILESLGVNLEQVRITTIQTLSQTTTTPNITHEQPNAIDDKAIQRVQKLEEYTRELEARIVKLEEQARKPEAE